MENSLEREVQLAREMLKGDVGAFETFVDVFRKRLFQYAYLMCGHREDAEEVAQETLLDVFKNLRSLREPEKIRSWVFRIAKNACLMKRRKSMYAPREELSIEELSSRTDQHGRQEIPDDSALPEDQMFRNEMSRALTRAIQSLAPAYRSVVLLRDIEELTTEEAAHVLDVSVDVVKQRLHRARVALRRRMEADLAPHRQFTPSARGGVNA